MRPPKHRQHRLLLCGLFFAAVQTLLAENPEVNAVQEALQDVRAESLALAARGARGEEWAKLERSFADLVERHPSEPSARSAFAEFLWERDDRESAIREWEAAERLAPTDATVLARLADAHLAAGRGKISAQYFRRASDAAPTDARLRHAAGNALFLFRHELTDAETSEDRVLALAVDYLAAASRLAPQVVDYARSYAETFYGLPKPDWSAALAAWEHYLEISPNRDFAHANLARVRLKLGHFDAARVALEKIESADFKRLKVILQSQIDAANSKKHSP